MYSFNSLARAHGEIQASGILRQSNEDFIVEEIMPVQVSGSGEHLWLQIRKNGCNTDWVARQLATLAGIKPNAVSYAGLKDRHALTTQWFSMHLPGCNDPDLSTFESEDVHILQSTRHDRKLRRGALSGNHFQLVVRSLSASRQQLEERLQIIADQGVPNYFGEQRFGHEMNNLLKAEAMFTGKLKRLKKQHRSIYLSAARSWIFDQLLSSRIKQGNWNSYLQGDVFQLAGKSACFSDDASEDIALRLAEKTIHPTGPLWGKGPSMAQGECWQLEADVAADTPLFCEGLIAAGMKQERRALRLSVDNFCWEFDDGHTLTLSFDLPAGAYATVVLREMINAQEA